MDSHALTQAPYPGARHVRLPRNLSQLHGACLPVPLGRDAAYYHRPRLQPGLSYRLLARRPEKPLRHPATCVKRDRCGDDHEYPVATSVPTPDVGPRPAQMLESMIHSPGRPRMWVPDQTRQKILDDAVVKTTQS